MLVKRNEKLSNYSLMRIGGMAENFYIPENKEELLKLVTSLEEKKQEYWIIGGGSNVLISDLRTFKHVIYMGKCNKEVFLNKDGVFYVGASVRLQHLILRINKLGYGGIEYLFSVPALVGGAVVMNAGRGKAYNKSLSDYILEVEVIHNGEIKVLKKEECRFSYRESIFKYDKYIVLGAYFRFVEMPEEETKELREKRIQYSKEKQDAGKPNLGSLLKHGNKIVYTILRKTQMGYKDGIHFSGKCNNWLVNEGKGTYTQALNVIEISKKLHRIMFCKQVLEVIIWH